MKGQAPVKTHLEKLKAAIRRDPKRSGVLAVLIVVLLGLFLRYRGGSPVPAAAEKADETAPDGNAAPEVPDLGRGAQLVALWAEQPVPHLSRNLFVSKLTQPPVETSAAPARADGLDEDGLFWRHLERALASRADREQYRRGLGEAALRDASKLAVTSIVIGPDSTALVDGKMVSVGALVPGGEGGPFTVVAIEPAHIVLARDGHRLVLKLGKPGAELSKPN